MGLTWEGLSFSPLVFSDGGGGDLCHGQSQGSARTLLFLHCLAALPHFNSPRTKYHVAHPSRVSLHLPGSLHPQKTGNTSLPKIITLKAPTAFHTVCLKTGLLVHTSLCLCPIASTAVDEMEERSCIQVWGCKPTLLFHLRGLADGSKCNDLRSQT